jgi:hypothetical protein
MLPLPGAKKANASPAAVGPPALPLPVGPSFSPSHSSDGKKNGDNHEEKHWWQDMPDGEGEDPAFWRAIAESLAESDDQQLNDAIEMSLNEEYMRTNDLEPVHAKGNGVCSFVLLYSTNLVYGVYCSSVFSFSFFFF